MGCGCGGKPWEPPKNGEGQPVAPSGPAGSANPKFTWPPRGNGPKPSSKA